MNKLYHKFRMVTLYTMSLLLVAGYPLAAFAEEAPVLEIEPVVVPAEPIVPPSELVTPVDPTPEPENQYSYNPTTGHWDSNTWYFDSATQSYQPVPQPIIIAPEPAAAIIDQPTTDVPKQVSEQAVAVSADTTAAIANVLDSMALTGDAVVTGNTNAGNATSGNAAAVATIINNVNSSMTSGDNQKAAQFVTNVIGDVQGDIMLQPMLLKAMLESQAPADSLLSMNNRTSVTNDVNLNATSGAADVTKNTIAGNATTGSADTVANVLNIVNSMVAANQSFIGTINIYGNLDGDILIAPDFIPQLLAANTASHIAGPTSTVVNSNDTQSIVNNVALAAESGAAAVTGNSTGGSATTGDALTNVVIFNLSGHQIVAANSLLVFVNVLGQWVGVIIDAPTGTTAAAIGNDVAQDIVTNPDLVIATTNDTSIVNNINLNSRSGNALVAGNTFAGNATSGRATASANIANISGSQLGLSGWFGVLFINVFGTWHGSFGINTLNGDPPIVPLSAFTDGVPPPVIQFVPHAVGAAPVKIVTNSGGSSSYIVTSSDIGTVLGSADEASEVIAMIPSVGAASDMRLPIVIGTLFLIGTGIVGLKRLFAAPNKVI